MSNLDAWAIEQIEKLNVPEERKVQYITVLTAFSDQGHSGFTAGYALSFIKKYIEEGYEPVVERLTGMLKTDTDDDGSQSAITKDILEIINLFKEYNFGENEAYQITRLMDWKPIIHLTGAEDEWGPANEWNGKVTQQNKICSAVFRDNHDNSTAHYLYGRVYSDNGGHTWFTGNHKDGVVKSSIEITFPYWVPDKSEYIYLNGDDSEEIITDKERIKELYDEWDKKFKD
jgi:hypothetical protein